MTVTEFGEEEDDSKNVERRKFCELNCSSSSSSSSNKQSVSVMVVTVTVTLAVAANSLVTTNNSKTQHVTLLTLESTTRFEPQYLPIYFTSSATAVQVLDPLAS
jgi:hypothetical protein